MSTFKGENEIDSDPDSIIPDNDESDASTQDGIDLVTEAEVYTEYGRYDQATELLQEEIAKNPKNKQAHIGLLKIYYKQKWTIDFQIKYEFVINEFKDNLTEEEITQLKTWGKEINPENPLYIESETVFEPL